MTDEMLSASSAVDPLALVDRELLPIVQMIQQMTAAMPAPSIEAMVQGRTRPPPCCGLRPRRRRASSASYQDRTRRAFGSRI